MILDTTFFIDILRGDKKAAEKLDELESKGELLSICAVSVFELWRGFGLAHTKQEEQAKSLIATLPAHIIDVPCAKRAGQLAYTLDRKGSPIDPEDLLIAGVALEKTESLLTRNVSHFERIEKLKVETY